MLSTSPQAAFRLIYHSGTVQDLAANIISKLAGTSEMPKSKGFKIIENLRAIFENRPHNRDGTLTYLTEVYRTVRKHPWITDDVDLELEREPRITNLFAHMIEVTSDLTPKMRSKYAKVLRIADEHKIRFRNFETFVKSKGGFNAGEVSEQKAEICVSGSVAMSKNNTGELARFRGD